MGKLGRDRWVRGARRFFSTDWPDQRRLAYLSMLAGAAELSLRVAPFPRVVAWFGLELHDGSTPAASTQPTPPDVEDAAREVDRVFRVLRPRNNCLRRSLVLGHLLRDRSPRLVIGVQAPKASGKFTAHAWLIVDGFLVPEYAAGAKDGFLPLRRAI